MLNFALHNMFFEEAVGDCIVHDDVVEVHTLDTGVALSMLHLDVDDKIDFDETRNRFVEPVGEHGTSLVEECSIESYFRIHSLNRTPHCFQSY